MGDAREIRAEPKTDNSLHNSSPPHEKKTPIRFATLRKSFLRESAPHTHIYIYNSHLFFFVFPCCFPACSMFSLFSTLQWGIEWFRLNIVHPFSFASLVKNSNDLAYLGRYACFAVRVLQFTLPVFIAFYRSISPFRGSLVKFCLAIYSFTLFFSTQTCRLTFAACQIMQLH